MIGKNTFILYKINSINEYWNLIYLAVENGNITDAKTYISRMNKSQKRDFMYFYIWDLSDEKMKKALTQFLIEDLTK